MKFINLHGSLLAGSLLVPGFSCHCASPTDGALPDASQVIERVVQRADDVARAGEVDKYAFEKHSISEELDTLGKATKTTERTYEVIPIQGVPFSRLVRIGNRNLTEQETKAQNRKELEFRKKVARNDAETMAEKNGNWLDKD